MSRPAVEVRAPQDGDVEAVLADVRPADVAEADALLGPGKLPWALAESVARSPLAWAAVDDAGALIALFGVAPANGLLGDKGFPWLIGTTRLPRHRRALSRLAPPYIDLMLEAFPVLLNLVDARNAVSLAWLRRVGFTIHPAAPAGAAGLPFHLFTLER